jgi:hypothetical protein
MAFAYYARLSRARKRTYQLSDAVDAIKLPPGHGLAETTSELVDALEAADRAAVVRACGAIAQGICEGLGVPAVKIKVLARRPSNSREELHGLYDPEPRAGPPEITVWMRTAQRKQVVAFRTFLRTLLHEICHHLDYEYLRFDESFHTEGFYKRESSLFRQLVGEQKV